MSASYTRDDGDQRQYRIGVCDTCKKAGRIDNTDMRLRPHTRITIEDLPPSLLPRTTIRPHHNSRSKLDGWICEACTLSIYANSPSEAKPSYTGGYEA
jgi:hypothetical protein